VAKEEAIQTEGRVEEVLPNAMFRVRIGDNHVITAIISGRMRQNRIQILLGDRVRIEMSPYDMTKGRVVYRER
jgi:translation initiation factor IF-1